MELVEVFDLFNNFVPIDDENLSSGFVKLDLLPEVVLDERDGISKVINLPAAVTHLLSINLVIQVHKEDVLRLREEATELSVVHLPQGTCLSQELTDDSDTLAFHWLIFVVMVQILGPATRVLDELILFDFVQELKELAVEYNLYML